MAKNGWILLLYHSSKIKQYRTRLKKFKAKLPEFLSKYTKNREKYLLRIISTNLEFTNSSDVKKNSKKNIRVGRLSSFYIVFQFYILLYRTYFYIKYVIA